MRSLINVGRQISTPIAFLWVQHPQNKYIYVYIPVFVSVCVVAFDIFIGQISIFGSGGLVSGSKNLLAILSGFFIVALAAVATFNKPDMDDGLAGIEPKLNEKQPWLPVDFDITRRRYLCLMFGYLSFLAIVLFSLGSVFGAISQNIVNFTSSKDALAVLRCVFLSTWTFMLTNLLLTTFMGVYFLSVGIHIDHPKLRPSDDEDHPE